MKRLALSAIFLATATLSAAAADGLITGPSQRSVAQTIDTLEQVLKAGGATIFARIDHAAGAASVGLPLRPTVLLIFGNPKGGTLLMQSQQTAGIDLPMKALAWEDAAGKVWLSYNDPTWIAARHGVGSEAAKAVEAAAASLKAATAKAVTGP